jgi:anti-anti-sigma factor
LNINVSKTGGLTVISVEGNLTHDITEEFEDSVGAVVNDGGKKIVFNLEKCNHISSLNLSVLVWAKKRVMELGGDAKIAGAGRVMVGLLKRTSLDQIFEIHHSIENAAKAFAVKGTRDGVKKE